VLREGRVRHLASQGAGDGSTVPRLRLRGPAAGALSGELAAKGREARGAAEEGARARRSTDVAQEATDQSWRLAHQALMRRGVSWVAARR